MIETINTLILGYTKAEKSSFVFYLFHKQLYENAHPTIGDKYNYKNKQFNCGILLEKRNIQLYFKFISDGWT